MDLAVTICAVGPEMEGNRIMAIVWRELGWIALLSLKIAALSLA